MENKEMTNKSVIDNRLWLCLILIVLAAASRLLPHPSNFTPIGALGLFAGAYILQRRFWLVPLVALFISDILIGFYNPVAMVSVYLAFAVCTVIGRVFLYNKRSILRVGFSALLSSCVFFILSNFGVWLAGLYYPMNFSGLLQCYAMAIPFFDNTLYGDLVYVTVLFGLYETVQMKLSNPQDLRTA